VFAYAASEIAALVATAAEKEKQQLAEIANDVYSGKLTQDASVSEPVALIKAKFEAVISQRDASIYDLAQLSNEISTLASNSADSSLLSLRARIDQSLRDKLNELVDEKLFPRSPKDYLDILNQEALKPEQFTPQKAATLLSFVANDVRDPSLLSATSLHQIDDILSAIESRLAPESKMIADKIKAEINSALSNRLAYIKDYLRSTLSNYADSASDRIDRVLYTLRRNGDVDKETSDLIEQIIKKSEFSISERVALGQQLSEFESAFGGDRFASSNAIIRSLQDAIKPSETEMLIYRARESFLKRLNDHRSEPNPANRILEALHSLESEHDVLDLNVTRNIISKIISDKLSTSQYSSIIKAISQLDATSFDTEALSMLRNVASALEESSKESTAYTVRLKTQLPNHKRITIASIEKFESEIPASLTLRDAIDLQQYLGDIGQDLYLANEDMTRRLDVLRARLQGKISQALPLERIKEIEAELPVVHKFGNISLHEGSIHNLKGDVVVVSEETVLAVALMLDAKLDAFRNSLASMRSIEAKFPESRTLGSCSGPTGLKNISELDLMERCSGEKGWISYIISNK
jgi:hypothetical protein